MKTVAAFEKACMKKATNAEKASLKRLLRLVIVKKGESDSQYHTERDDEHETESDDEEDTEAIAEMKAKALEKGLKMCAPTDEFGCPILPDEAMSLFACEIGS